LPQEYWRDRTLKEVASVVGTTISFDAPARNRAFRHYAQILVDIDLSKRVYDEILVEREGFAFKVEVQYERHPFFCHHFYVIGHNVTKCKWLHLNAAKDVERGKNQVTEPNNKATLQPRGAKGASSSGMFKYVAVETAPAAPNKDVAASSFSFALQNVSDVIPPSCFLIQISLCSNSHQR